MPPLCKEAIKIKEMIKFPLVAIDITEIYFLLCVVLLTQMVVLPFFISIVMHERGYDFSAETRSYAKLAFWVFFRWRWGCERWWQFLQFFFLVAAAGSRPKLKWELGMFLELPYFGGEVWVLHEVGTVGQCPAQRLLRPAEPVSVPWQNAVLPTCQPSAGCISAPFDSSLKGLFSKSLSSRGWPQLT